MADFDKAPAFQSTIDDPAAPEGLKQVAAEGLLGQAQNAGLQPWFGDSYVNAAQSWYGGRNVEGENNGWSTDFMAKTMDYAEATELRAGEQNNPTLMWTMFDTSIPENAQATGVASWDDAKGRWKRGDVFEDGEKVSNLYESMDEESANLILADFMFTAEQKRDIFADSDRVARLNREVEQQAKEYAKMAEAAPQAFEYDAEVQARQAELQANSFTDPATVAGGAAGGAVLGAGVGAVFGGVGAVPGAIVGGVIGGVGAWLNQDQLTEQVARAQEITDRAMTDYDPLRGSLISMKEWGAVLMRGISPFSNTWQGAYDLLGGGVVGDGRSEFYEVNAFGERKASAWVQGGDIVASLGDSAAQFTGAGGRFAYMGVMGMTATGGLAAPMLTGTVFNQRTGQWDALENATEWASGLLSPVIDVAQMGMARGVTKAATAPFREAEAVAKGAATYEIERGGMRFVRDTATGEITSVRKWTVGALAPSENIWQVPIRWKARQIALKDGRDVVSKEDLFRAAQTITANSSPWRGALVNGLAEGYEEAWQGILDPLSVGDNIDGGAVFVQAMYGAAGGIGMSSGALMQRSKQGVTAWRGMQLAKVDAEARLKYAWRTGTVATDEQWAAFKAGLSEDELRRFAASDEQEAREIGGLIDSMADMLAIDNSRASVLGPAFAQRITEIRESKMNRTNPNAEESLSILGFEGTELVNSSGAEYVARSNSALLSANQLMTLMTKRVQATQQQERTAPAELVPEIQARLLVQERMQAMYADLWNRLDATTSIDEAKAIVAEMNDFLTAAYDGEVRDGAGKLLPPEDQAYWKKAATFVFGRHPFLDSGSFAGFIPQVSYTMTLERVDAAVGIHQSLLKPLQADHDGDRTTSLNLVYLPDETITQLRRGLQQISNVANTVTDANGDEVVSGSKLTHGIDMPDGERTRLIVWAEELRKPTSTPEYGAVMDGLFGFEQWLLDRLADRQMMLTPVAGGATYTPGAANPDGVMSWDAITALSREFRESIEAGNHEAMQNLRDAILNQVGADRLGEISDKQPVLLEIQQEYTNRMLGVTKKLARLRMTSTTATPLLDQRRPDDVQNQKGISRAKAQTMSEELGLLGSNEPTRDSQRIWYDPLSRVLADTMAADGNWTLESQQRLAALFMMQTSGDSRTDLEKFLDKDPVQTRVMTWLDGLVSTIEGQRDPAFRGMSLQELRVVLAQMQVPSVMRDDSGRATAHESNTTSLLQYLLRRSIEMEKDQLSVLGVPQDDPRWRKLTTLTALTYDNRPHSYTPKTALVEMFRFMPLHLLVGEGDADFLGSNATLDQLERELQGMDETSRKDAIHRYKRRAGAYMTEAHRGLGDPPYHMGQLRDDKGRMRVNAYTLVIDALETSLNKKPVQWEASNKLSSEQMRTGWKDLQNFMDQLEAQLLSEEGSTELSREDLVRKLIVDNPQLASMITALVPQAALSGTFLVENGKVYEAPWLMAFLTADNEFMAEKLHFIYSQLAAYNMYGASVDRSELEGLTGKERQARIKEITGKVKFSTLKSRFAQTLHIAASDPTGTLLVYMLQKMDRAETLDEMMAEINKVPALIQDRAPLLPYLDDVATFESRPQDLWSMGLTSTQMTEALAKWSTRIAQMSAAQLQEWQIDADDKVAMSDLLSLIQGKAPQRNAEKHLKLLRQAIANRKARPDSIGPSATMNFLRVAWDPFVPMQDKGAAPEVAQFVEAILTTFSWGVQQGWEQALDSVAAVQWADIATNVTKLLEGPVQIMMPDGTTLLLDMSQEETVARMLKDDRTRAFAKAVVFETVRDIDVNNSLQHYQSTTTQGGIVQMLEEQDNSDILRMSEQDPVLRTILSLRGMGLVQSALIKKAMTGDVAEQGAALLPITRAIGEILNAYNTRSDAGGMDREMIQRQVIQDVWSLLVSMSMKSDLDRERIRNEITTQLRARIGGANVLALLEEQFNETESGKAMFQSLIIPMKLELQQKSAAFQETARDYANRMEALPDAGQRTLDEEREWNSLKKMSEVMLQRAADLQTQIQAIESGQFELVDASVLDVDLAIQMYTMANENEPGIDQDEQNRRIEKNMMTRLNIRNILEEANNKEMFRDKGVAGDLLTKLSQVNEDNLDLLNDPNFIKEKEWKELGAWAATVHFTKRSERSGDASLRSVSDDGARRLYDRSYQYLTDILFNDKVLAEVRDLFNPELSALPNPSMKEIVAKITGRGGILDADRLGPWHTSVVTEGMKISELIRRGPVGLAVPASGNHAKRQRAFTGTATITTDLPDPAQHLKTVTFNPDSPDPALMRLIMNGFFSEMKLTTSSGTTDLDIKGRVGVESAREGVKGSGYVILRRRQFDEAIDNLTKQGIIQTGDTVEITVTFVDPDSKPFTAEYVNNVFFDKAGRTEETMPRDDVISQTIFSTGGVAKISQQMVFDVPGRGGSAGFPTATIPQSSIDSLVGSPADVAEYIRRAAQLILDKQYNDMTNLLDVDQAAVVKLLKQRMVVIGEVNGVKEAHWVDEVISWRGQLPFDVGTAQIVELSADVASTLLSEQSMRVVSGLVTAPLLNPNQMPVPLAESLSTERLARLGITGLGEVMEWDDPRSPLWSVAPLRKAVLSSNRGDVRARTYRDRMERWERQVSTVLREEPQSVTEKWEGINREVIGSIGAAFSENVLLTAFGKMGLTPEIIGNNPAAADHLLRTQIQRIVGVMSGRRAFRYTTKDGNLNLGKLAKVHLEDDFSQAGDRPPVFGDIVEINLDQFITGPMTTESVRQAAREVAEVMEAFGRRGVTIFLTSTTMSSELKEQIAVWMDTDPFGYEPVGDSTSVYVPVLEFGPEGKTMRAMRQSLTETQPFNPHYVTGRILSDEYFALAGASEGTVFVDTTYEKGSLWKRFCQLLIPGDLTIADSKGSISLNYPTDQQMKLLQQQLMPLVDDPTEWRRLMGQTNAEGDPDLADPADIAVYGKSTFANGKGYTKPGILSQEDARQRLADMLKRGYMPRVNDDILPGDWLPIVNVNLDGTLSVVMTRVGFKLPDETRIRQQWSSTAAGRTIQVAVATNAVNDNQTVPPPMTITKEPIYTAHGLLLVGDFDHDKWGKWIDAALGWKSGRIKMSDISFVGDMAQNGFRPSEGGSLTGQAGKRAMDGTVTNFRNLFMVTGFDIRNLLVDAIMGEQANEQAYKDAWSLLEEVLNAWARKEHGLTEHQVADMMALDQLPLQWQEFGLIADSMKLPRTPMPDGTQFVDDPKTRVAALAIAAMMAPRVRVRDIVSVPGMLSVPDVNSDTFQVVPLPRIFTDALQSPHSPATTKWLIEDYANGQIAPDATGRRLYRFDTNFKFWSIVKDSKGVEMEIGGWLQLVKPMPATEDLNAYADANLKARKDTSLHIAGLQDAALDAVTVMDDIEDQMSELTDGDKIVRFGAVTGRGIKGNLWDMLTRIAPREDTPHRLLPLQWKYLKDSIDDVRGYCMAYDKSSWDDDELRRVRELQKLLLTELGLIRNLENERVEVDYLVRQFYGSPGARDGQENFIEPVSATDYIEAVRIMLKQAKDHRNPLEAGKVPYPHEALWQKIYQAKRWAPRLGSGKQMVLADGWDQYVYALFGQVENSRQTVDTRFRRPMDGFMHTYMDSLPALANVPVSGDDAINRRLMDVQVNEHFISMDPGVEAMLSNPIILGEMEKTISNMMGLTQDYDPTELASMNSSALAAHRDRVERWSKSRDMAPQVMTSYKEYMEMGTEYVGRSGGTHAMLSGMVNLSLMNRLFNPALFVSAMFEVWSRTSLQTFTDLVTGDQLRAGGVLANRAADVLESTTGLRWRPRYSERDIQLVKSLARELSTNTDFMEFLYKELVYTSLIEKGRGGLSKMLESGASKSARAFADPRWGMPSVSVAQLYLGQVIEHMTTNGAQFDLEGFVQQMKQDPLMLMKDHRENGGGFTAHQAGVNRVAQIRSLKATVLGKMVTAPINTMTQGTLGYNVLGHLLKIPFQFAAFTANAVISLTGMQGVDQIFGMMLDGQKKPGFMNRIGAHVRGEKPLKDTFDMSDVLESIDLSNIFIRGGVTQTGLFAAALFASGLGLGGEDEEMRKRRKLAEYMNTPLILDPREMQNDFRYADAIFLDEIPLLGTIFEDEDMPEGERRSVVVPHWIIRQFTSPMMGTMRFLQTGDTSDITQGFMEAFSVLPYSLLNLWNEAVMTADLVFEQAAAKDYEGNSTSAQVGVTELLITGVSIYEKALLENSFINNLRNGADQYNRNPWLMPRTDATGNIEMREGTNNMPLPSQALTSFRDPQTGEVRQAYDTRTGLDGYAHGYAENNLTFSLLASLFTGQIGSESSFLRNNMVVGETKIKLPVTPAEQAGDYFLSAFHGAGGQLNLTFDEAVRVVKAKYEAADVRWSQPKVEKEAKVLMDNANADGRNGGMSLLSADGREELTTQGAKGVLWGLYKGSVEFKDAALTGVWIDAPTREKIEAEWAEELMQEGVDMGLPQQSAEFRMRRIMYGDATDPSAPGLRSIIYSKDIPYSGTARYNQLNTTFMIGPDGRPWATPFGRQNALATLGIPLPQVPLPAGEGMRKDARGNLVDEVYGINLGVMALERQLEEPPEPPDRAVDQAAAKTYTPQQSNDYTPFKRFSSGGGGGYGPNFSRMPYLPGSRTTPYSDDIPFINSSNPYIRRASINKERITSDRGRLNQWQ